MYIHTIVQGQILLKQVFTQYLPTQRKLYNYVGRGTYTCIIEDVGTNQIPT